MTVSSAQQWTGGFYTDGLDIKIPFTFQEQLHVLLRMKALTEPEFIDRLEDRLLKHVNSESNPHHINPDNLDFDLIEQIHQEWQNITGNTETLDEFKIMFFRVFNISKDSDLNADELSDEIAISVKHLRDFIMSHNAYTADTHVGLKEQLLPNNFHYGKALVTLIAEIAKAGEEYDVDPTIITRNPTDIWHNGTDILGAKLHWDYEYGLGIPMFSRMENVLRYNKLSAVDWYPEGSIKYHAPLRGVIFKKWIDEFSDMALMGYETDANGYIYPAYSALSKDQFNLADSYLGAVYISRYNSPKASFNLRLTTSRPSTVDGYIIYDFTRDTFETSSNISKYGLIHIKEDIYLLWGVMTNPHGAHGDDYDRTLTIRLHEHIRDAGFTWYQYPQIEENVNNPFFPSKTFMASQVSYTGAFERSILMKNGPAALLCEGRFFTNLFAQNRVHTFFRILKKDGEDIVEQILLSRDDETNQMRLHKIDSLGSTICDLGVVDDEYLNIAMNVNDIDIKVSINGVVQSTNLRLDTTDTQYEYVFEYSDLHNPNCFITELNIFEGIAENTTLEEMSKK